MGWVGYVLTYPSNAKIGDQKTTPYIIYKLVFPKSELVVILNKVYCSIYSL